jgi:hypothetical protein
MINASSSPAAAAGRVVPNFLGSSEAILQASNQSDMTQPTTHKLSFRRERWKTRK